MVPSPQHCFTDDDIKKIIENQGKIQQDIAVAANNLTWIIATYKSQTEEINKLTKRVADLEKLVGDMTVTIWKYIGMGAGAVLVVEIIVMALPYVKGVVIP
jgi:t-SNARE complex subunit (syntaxin)